MRLATMVTPRGLRLHARARSGYVDVADAAGNEELASLQGLLDAGNGAMDAVRGLLDTDGTEFGPADFGPAVPEPRRVLCLGVNYREHAIEGGRAVPTWPEAFVRGAGSALGPYADLVKPALTERFDYEGELAWSSGPGAATSGPTRRWTRSRDMSCSMTPPAATGSGRRRSGPPARTSRAACRSGPSWSRRTRPT